MKGPSRSSRISTTLPPINTSTSNRNSNNSNNITGSSSISSSSNNKTTTMKHLLTPSSTRSVQGTRVQQELEVLRQKQLAQSQRNKLKDRTYILVASTVFMYIYLYTSILMEAIHFVMIT